MIIDSFKENEHAIMTAKDFCGEGKDLGEVCVVFFSADVLQTALSTYDAEPVALISKSMARETVYRIKGTKILFYHTQMGGPAAGMLLDEAYQETHANHFIVFGSAGVLNNELGHGKIMVPSCAYRDEGFSYHYKKPSDYIEIKNANFVADFLKESNIPYAIGGTWTTDAFYNETKEAMAKRVEEGCISVDMEAASLQALCDYRGYQYYTFFFGGDLLDAPIWDYANLGDEKERKSQLNAFSLAVKLARKIIESR